MNISIGDWVVLKHFVEQDLTKNERIFKVSHIDAIGNCFGPNCKFSYVNEQFLDKWIPTSGEECVFFNTLDGIKIISQFYAIEHDQYTESIEFKNYKYCEPSVSLGLHYA